MRRFLRVTGLTLAVASCGSPEATPDANAVDAVVTPDASPQDASRPTDAPTFDAFADDVPAIDAPPADAGPVVAPCAGDELFTVTFQTGSMPTNVTREVPMQSTPADPRLSVVAAPWDASRWALRAVIRNGDDSGSGYPRSEITPAISPHMAFGTHYCFQGGYWIDGSSSFPRPTSTRSGLMVAPLQLHGRDGISPILALQFLEDDAQLAYIPGDNATLENVPLGAIPVDRYVSFQLDYVGSMGSDGYLRLVLDDEVVLERSGANHVGPRTTNPDAGFFKMGLYDFWSTVPTAVTLYIDDLHVFRM